MNFELLTEGLLKWYDRMRRDLPWRRETDPYRIWVSEIMLQQTRVETVIPYYQRFLQRFPDMQALSAAGEDELLSVWQGLGYYSRARNLQQGVREVVERYGGQVPDSHEAVLSLPGIGAYTAGAILSIAHNKPEPAIDGNVLRVFSRLLKIEEPIEKPQTKRRIETAVRTMMAAIPRYGDITQALMELGAIVCIPRNPRCDECPWTKYCLACKDQVQGLLPKKKSPEPPRIVEVYSGILIEDGRVLAMKRPAKGLLAGMWEFPSAEAAAATDTTGGGIQLLCARFRAAGREVTVDSQWRTLTHTFSHREWRMRVFLCQASPMAGPMVDCASWMDAERIREATWAGPHRKVAAWVGEEFRELLQEKGK